jgi:tRNA(adenine34) deaminase
MLSLSADLPIARVLQIMPQESLGRRERAPLARRFAAVIDVWGTVTTNEQRDEFWMGAALAEADLAALAGDVPVGAVIIGGNDQLLALGRNRRELDQDPTAHAEIVALRAAAQKVGHWRIEGATLYCTLEPCAMCAGALVNARISRVVYGAIDPKAGGVQSVFTIGSDNRLNHRFQTLDGVLRDACVLRLQRFFAALRADGQK